MKIEKTQSNMNFNGIFRLNDKRLIFGTNKYSSILSAYTNNFVELNNGYTHTISGTQYIFSKAADDKKISTYLTGRKLDFVYSDRHEFFDKVLNMEKGIVSDRDAQSVAGLKFTTIV
jgi:hypothetical protein